MKKILIALILLIVLSAGIFLLLDATYAVPILMYHSISANDNSYSVTPEKFAYAMAYLHHKKYNVISLDELVSGMKTHRRFPRNSVAITFDDGYEDNYINAFPILNKYKFPATIFMATAKAGLLYEGDQFLSWDQIKLMSANGISFGSHTHNHRYIPSLETDEDVRVQFVTSKQLLETHTGLPVEYLCYPLGAYTERAREIAREVGFLGACTTNRGPGRINHDVYALKRVKMSNKEDTPIEIWVKVSGYYHLNHTPRKPY